MDMNTLIHHRGGDATTTSSVATTASTSANTSSFRAPATNVSPFPQNPSLPGLRAHLPSLPIRLAALHPSPADHHQPPPRPSASLSSSAAGSGSAPPSSQATSLAPLRFIIPSSHCPPTHGQSNAYTGNATSDHGSTTINIRPAGSIQSHHIKQEPTSANATNVPRSFSDPSLSVQDRQVLHHQHNRPPPLDIALLIASANTANEMDGAASTDGSLTDGKTKKSPGKRNRAVKNPNRSTKSKARPGLRKGKWTEEEERYATQLTNYFKEGLLPIERGTMLRLYLSQKLNCEPMRITKKFTGGECIGKQVFRPCSPTPDTRVRLMQAQLELVALEAAFIKKLKENKEEVPGLTDDVDMSLAPGAIAGSARPKKRRPYHKERKSDGDAGGDDDTRDDGFTSDSSTSSDNTSSAHADGKKNGDNVDDASAVGLLLDFFYKASNKNDKNGTAASSKPSSSSASSSSSMPLFPKREVSTATSVASSEPDPELEDEQPYKLANEELANSPTKRMRTLSISQCHTDVTTSPKRSRLGSFTAVTSHP